MAVTNIQWAALADSDICILLHDMIPMKTFTFTRSFSSFHFSFLFLSLFLFLFPSPAMQSTLGSAGVSRHSRGVLNGALAE